MSLLDDENILIKDIKDSVNFIDILEEILISLKDLNEQMEEVDESLSRANCYLDNINENLEEIEGRIK